MKTQEIAKASKATQSVQLVKGEFTPSEALEVVKSLINEKINFHKIQRLQIWEENHDSQTTHLDNRIDELRQEKELVTTFITNLKDRAKTIKINGVLEISVIE